MNFKDTINENKMLGNLLREIGINSPEQMEDSIKPLQPLEVFDIIKPLQIEIDKETDVGLSRFTQILEIPRIKSYPKIIALSKKAKALDKAIQTLNKALQTPSKHR